MESESPSMRKSERQARQTDETSTNDFTVSPSQPAIGLPVEDFLTQLEAWSLPPLEAPLESPEYESKLQAWCKRFEPVMELFRENRLLKGHVASLLTQLESPGWEKQHIADHEAREAIRRAREENENELRNRSENDYD